MLNQCGRLLLGCGYCRPLAETVRGGGVSSGCWWLCRWLRGVGGWRQSLPCPLASAWLTWARWRRLSGRGVVCLARASGVVGLVDHHQYLSLSLYVLGDLSQPVLVVWQGPTEGLPALPAQGRGPVLTPCWRPVPMKTSMSSMSSMSIPPAASRRMGGWWATGPAPRMRETSAAFRQAAPLICGSRQPGAVGDSRPQTPLVEQSTTLNRSIYRILSIYGLWCWCQLASPCSERVSAAWGG